MIHIEGPLDAHDQDQGQENQDQGHGQDGQDQEIDTAIHLRDAHFDVEI